MAQDKKHITYADAGVDVDEGARAVEAIKESVAKTMRPEVIGGLGGFGSCFSAAAIKDMDDPVLVSTKSTRSVVSWRSMPLMSVETERSSAT